MTSAEVPNSSRIVVTGAIHRGRNMAVKPLDVSQIARLPDISSARLPTSYVAAKQAIEICSRIDECHKWANKSEALASYAKQADDDTLRRFADRIQARAIKRCGELLRQIPSHRGGNLPNVTAPSGPSRTQAAEEAGMSERQKVTALRVANVPRDEFERLVEDSEPPTVTQLAEIGRIHKPRPLVDLGGRDPGEFAISTKGQGMLRELAEFGATTDPAVIARGALDHELGSIQRNIEQAKRWLDQLMTAVGSQRCSDRLNSAE